VWYQNIGSALFDFVTKHASDGQTDGQTEKQNYDSQERPSVAARAAKSNSFLNFIQVLYQPTAFLLVLLYF